MNNYAWILKLGTLELALYASDVEYEIRMDIPYGIWIYKNHPISKNKWLLRLIVLFCGGFENPFYSNESLTYFVFLSEQGRAHCCWLIGSKEFIAIEDNTSF